MRSRLFQGVLAALVFMVITGYGIRKQEAANSKSPALGEPDRTVPPLPVK